MSNSIIHRRLDDRNSVPTEEQIMPAIGSSSVELWKRIRSFLKELYTFEPELHFYGSKYGWCYKYVRKGKTLCVLFPKTDAFTVLVVLGKKKLKNLSIASQRSIGVRRRFSLMLVNTTMANGYIKGF